MGHRAGLSGLLPANNRLGGLLPGNLRMQTNQCCHRCLDASEFGTTANLMLLEVLFHVGLCFARALPQGSH